MEYFLIETADRAYRYNEFNMKPHPITHYVETDRDIVSLFDSITYSKGKGKRNSKFCFCFKIIVK